jgi:hypothetical protein
MEVGLTGSIQLQLIQLASKSTTAAYGEFQNTATAVIRCQSMGEGSATQSLVSQKIHMTVVHQVGQFFYLQFGELYNKCHKTNITLIYFFTHFSAW